MKRNVKIKKDVEMVKKEARVVVRLDKNNNFKIVANSKARLGVIAIIGPTEGYKEVVLLEIGTCRSKPYHEARKPYSSKRQDEACNIPSRKKCFHITMKQYIKLAPFIFTLIQSMADEKVLKWKTGVHNNNPFLIKSTNRYYLKRRKADQLEMFKSFPSGVRFAVSIEDRMLLSDIFYAELNLNFRLQKDLEGLSRFIKKRLDNYKNGYKKSFSQLGGAIEIKNNIESRNRKFLKSYHLFEMMTQYFSKNNIFRSNLLDLFELDGFTTTEHKLVSSCYLNPKTRLNNMQLRVTTGLDGKRDHIVFEVLPTWFKEDI